MACPPSSAVKQNYFSIDDILMSSEMVKCTFLTTVQGLGSLDPGNNSKDISEGSKVDLPLWLADELANKRRNYVTISLPKPYKEVYREILIADADVVDLHKLGPYFYALGQQVLSFESEEATFVAQSLLETFSKRFRKIMDLSTNAFHENISQSTEKFDEIEKRLFFLGHQNLLDFKKWELGTMQKITASEMVTQHRKRKRDGEDVNT